MQPLRILFLTEDREDYLADGLLHGLRHTPWVEVVDEPRKHCLYSGEIRSHRCPELGVRGGGFNLYGTLSTRGEPERNQIFRKLERGWFDLVILGNVWRQWGQLLDRRDLLGTVPLALLDGDDDPRLYPGSTTHLRRFGPWRSLAALLGHPRCLYFKREWQVAGPLARAGGRWIGLNSSQIRPTSFSIPEDKLVDSSRLDQPRPQRFPTHIVDPEVQELVGGQMAYAFSSEADYNADLRRSRFGITSRRSGWDCLRHLELAANGCVLCFRDLTDKPASCAPHGLHAGNCISYRSGGELLERLDKLPSEEEDKLRKGAWAWARAHTTRKAAALFLEAFGWRDGAPLA
ncbi:MAG: hypothetical protein WCK64_02935 [Synechococcaceae cyanobacterium ELA445]